MTRIHVDNWHLCKNGGNSCNLDLTDYNRNTTFLRYHFHNIGTNGRTTQKHNASDHNHHQCEGYKMLGNCWNINKIGCNDLQIIIVEVSCIYFGLFLLSRVRQTLLQMSYESSFDSLRILIILLLHHLWNYLDCKCICDEREKLSAQQSTSIGFTSTSAVGENELKPA